MCTATKIYAERASVSTPIAAFLVLQGMNFALFFFCIDQDILSETPGRKNKKREIGHGKYLVDGGVARGAQLISRFHSQVSGRTVGNQEKSAGENPT